MTTTIIGITGHYGAGKDTVAEIVISLLHRPLNPWCRIAFADVIKKHVAQKIGVTIEALEKLKKEPTIRKLLQEAGDSGKRENPDYWIRQLDAQLLTNESLGIHNNYVISDLRFLNEAKWIRETFKRTGKIIRVERPGFAGDNHVSETEQEKIRVDYHILNDQTRLKLINETRNILRFLKLL
jgi:hypothetical protein